eukprot:CAMPEP_0175837604 /NCGR_PEP_ID=MMETSP0107_2-20121207/17782_1 /TAXON_ID=195067 ORGANISM="Goniomonas pacifica, Strain CCMP1869" /NCGR_SAMPLE_ID=MMETSP0107_2 /ASSEMBLY_ACC=CAM_ASM_000203 /LENGTH=61 /DNA_ID=CAMNT_0017151111 /DNA_START=570 /DNA_END=752 /DNA_ORIENTATION=-
MGGNTPLHWSADCGRLEVSQMLIGAGADIHRTNNLGETPLHRSTMFGYMEVSQMLVGAGAN